MLRSDLTIDCIFADPPDNIGLDYGDGGKGDRVDDDKYVGQLADWVGLFTRRAKTVWISFNAKWTLEMGEIVADLVRADPTLTFKPCVQTFSFYQHCKTDLGNAHRPLWRIQQVDAPLYPDQIKIPSWRQQNGDARATAGGKTPGDAFNFTELPTKHRRVWHQSAVQCGKWAVDALIPDDHFNFTRVVGNSKQRRRWHPTQLNEGLVERAIKLVTKAGDWVVDPFGGTGTTLRVCREIGRNCTLMEANPDYCQEIQAEHGMVLQKSGEYPLWNLTTD
jgi:hypothetical protein